jgi:5-methyltetrahydrofolate--homocysteine methyltransferase
MMDSSVEQCRGVLLRHAMVPVAIQSNAGLPKPRAGEPACAESPGFMAAQVPGLTELGFKIIDGCCGLGPEHIRAIRPAVDSRR